MWKTEEYERKRCAAPIVGHVWRLNVGAAYALLQGTRPFEDGTYVFCDEAGEPVVRIPEPEQIELDGRTYLVTFQA